MAIEDKVKLTVVRSGSPDIETELGIYPSKSEALPAFEQVKREADVLGVYIKPVNGDPTPENSASYTSKREIGTQ
jgi:hypothetical protein